MRPILLVLLMIPMVLKAQQIQDLLMAEEALASGDTTRALIVFREVLKEYPDSYAAALRLTEVNYQQGFYSEAIQFSHITEDVLLRKLDSLADETNPGNDSLTGTQLRKDLASLYHFKGKIRLKQHRGQSALDELHRALKYGADSSAILVDRGLVYLEMNNVPEARRDFRLAMKLAPEKAGAAFNMGNTFYNEGAYDSAAIFYEKAANARPPFVWANAYLGEINTRKKNYEQAVDNYTAFLAKQSSAEIYFKRAVLYAELRNWELSLSDWDSVLSIDPDNAAALRNRGLSHFQLQDYASAIEDFSQALVLDIDPYTYINRGYSYYLSGDSKAALEDYNSGLPDLPEYALGHYLRSLAYMDRRKRKQACMDLERALSLGMAESDVDKDLLGYCK